MLAAALAGCGGIGRSDYVEANERLFGQLPSFPGARLEGETSTGYRHDESAPITGYGTRFELNLDPPICAGGALVWTRQAAPRPASGPCGACTRPVRSGP